MGRASRRSRKNSASGSRGSRKAKARNAQKDRRGASNGKPRQRWRTGRDEALDAPPPAPSRKPRTRAWTKSSNKGKTEDQIIEQQRQREQDRAAAGLSGRAPVASSRPLPQDVVREASYEAGGGVQGLPLHIIRAKVPWRRSSGKSCALHPLARDDFWDQHFGRHSFALLRGPRHRVPVPMSTAKKLLPLYRVGVDADVVGPYLWSAGRRQLPGEPNLRGPATAAIERGRAVRLRNVNRRVRGITSGDPLFKALARLAPGRGVSSSINWTPPGVAALPPHEETSHQLIVQLHGARRWTVCTRGRYPSKTALGALDVPSTMQGPMEVKKPGLCTKVMLRRGDALYVPSMTWHWTDKGPRTAVHATWEVTPLIGADLLKVLGMREQFSGAQGLVPSAALGLPLPLWHARSENSLTAVADLCADFPKGTLARGAEVMCTVSLVKLALQRLGAAAGASSKAKPRQNMTAEETERARAFSEKLVAERIPREARRKKTQLYITIARRFSEGLLLLVGVGILLWCCCAEPDPDSLAHRRKQTRPTKGQPRGLRGIRARAAAKKQRSPKYE